MQVSMGLKRVVAVSDEVSPHRGCRNRRFVPGTAFFVCIVVVSSGIAAQSVGSVRSFDLENNGAGIEIEIGTDPQVRYRYFQLEGPRRLVIDFADAQNRLGFANLPVATEGVIRVRTGQFDDGQMRAARIVFDLEPETTFRVTGDEPGLVTVLFSTAARTRPEENHTERPEASPANPSTAENHLTVEMVDGRVSVLADRVALWRVLAELDRVVGTESTVRAELAGYPVSVRFQDLDVNLAIRQILEPYPLDYAIIGTRIRVTSRSQPLVN